MPFDSTPAGCPMGDIGSDIKQNLKYIRKKLKEKYGDETPARTFHAKSIGLVEAKLEVPDIRHKSDKNFRVGLFEKPGMYKAWIRFTNGSDNPNSADGKSGARGMAIKVLNVPGTSFLDKDQHGNTQDIILLTSRNFVPGTGGLSLNGVKVALGTLGEKIINFLEVVSVSTRGVLTFIKSPIKTPNILEEMYFSCTPYAFGDKQAIKWHVKPLKTITSLMPIEPVENFLRERLIRDLSKYAKEDVSFALYVQFQENPEKEPIDNSAVIWKTKFYRVATIHIPKQKLNTPERMEMDKKLTFSPGHASMEHRPLGTVNAVRRKVYEVLAKERLAH